MAKQLLERNYLLAIQAADINNYLPINDNPYEGGIKMNEVSVPSKLPTPEEVCIKRDSFEKLSSEAKEVVKLILECPVEFFEMIWPRKKEFKDRVLGPYFRKRWLEGVKVKNVMDELKDFVGDF